MRIIYANFLRPYITLLYYSKPVERKGFDELHVLIRHIY
jgi:hypothetical protein